MPVIRAGARIQRQIDAGADADFEHVRAGANAHLLDRLDAAGMQRRTIGVVVDLRDVLVDLLDEVRPDSRDRQCARCRVARTPCLLLK